MRIAIMGAGAMGSVVGAYLQEGGAEVTLITRNAAHAERVAGEGLLYCHTQGGQTRHKMNASASAEGLGVMDVVIFLVKGPDTKAALEQSACLFDEHTIAVTLQNGIGNTELIEKRVPRERILYGCLNMSAIMTEPGVVSGNVFGDVHAYLGGTESGSDAEQTGKALCALLEAAGVKAVYTDDIDYHVWNKILVNIVVNATCGLVRLRGGEAGKSAYFSLVGMDMISETVAVAHALGVEKLDAKDFLKNALPGAKAASGGHYPSMAQDMMIYKRKTEIEFLNGAIEKLGKKLGIPTPVNTTVARLVRTVEANYALQYEPGKEEANV